MSLYDIMNKKAKAPVDGPTEPVVPQVEVEEVKVENPAIEVLKPETSDMSWWQSPNLVAEQEKYEAATRSRMEADEARAKRMRNAAIIGDIARLGAQAYSLGKGGTKIKEFTPATSTANEKIQALRDKHSAQLAEFVKQRAAAREAERVDNNAKGKMKAELDAAARKGKQSVVEHLYKVQRDIIADQQKAKELEIKIADIKAKHGYNAAKLEQDAEYKNALLELKKLHEDSQDAYRRGMLRVAENKAMLAANEKGDYVLSIAGQPSMVFPRQFYLDNEAQILGAVRKDWEAGLQDLQQFKYQVGDIKAPTDSELKMMISYSPSAAAEIARLYDEAHKLRPAATNNIAPASTIVSDSTSRKKANPMGGKKTNPMK
jgi:hypothetical protein